MRYYDRIDLLKPDYVSPETGYRYYTIYQYEKLGTILELRALQMPLNQIQEYFNERNVKKSAAILQQYQHEFEQKLKEDIQLNAVMKEKLSYLSHLDHLVLNRVWEQTFPERYMITFSKPSGNQAAHDYAYTKLEWYLNEQETAPILATDRVGVYADEGILENSSHPSAAYPMIFVKHPKQKMKYLQTIPQGRYACMDYSNGRLETYHESFKIMKQYLRENHLAVTGHILQFYVVDVTLTNDRRETILQIQVPIRSV